MEEPHKRGWRLRRCSAQGRVLEAVLTSLRRAGERRDLRRRCARPGLAGAYARFRAACERRGDARRLADGSAGQPRSAGGNRGRAPTTTLTPSGSPSSRWRGGAPRDAAGRLYLDMPLGVNPVGYDVWRDRDGFAEEISRRRAAGPVLHAGQDWGLPAAPSERMRESGYAVPRIGPAALLRRRDSPHRPRHGLHRLYWIPQGVPPPRGLRPLPGGGAVRHRCWSRTGYGESWRGPGHGAGEFMRDSCAIARHVRVQ